MPKRLPPDRDLILLFQNHSISELALMFQVKENTVARRLAQASHLNHNPLFQERYEKIKAMLKEGKTYTKIGAILGISGSAVEAFAQRHGIKKYEVNFGLVIGCPNCPIQPYARGLCFLCYQRFKKR